MPFPATGVEGWSGLVDHPTDFNALQMACLSMPYGNGPARNSNLCPCGKNIESGRRIWWSCCAWEASTRTPRRSDARAKPRIAALALVCLRCMSSLVPCSRSLHSHPRFLYHLLTWVRHRSHENHLATKSRPSRREGIRRHTVKNSASSDLHGLKLFLKYCLRQTSKIGSRIGNHPIYH